MKKFIYKLCIGISILGTLLFILNYAYTHTEYYQNLNDMKKFKEIPDHIDIANFGASHSENAYEWENYTEFHGMDMALGSQTLVYDEALFNYYFDRFDQNSTVILEIMFKSLYELEQKEGPYPTNILRYYQILDKEHIKQWNIQDAINYQYIPVLGNRQNALKQILAEMIGGQPEEKAADVPEKNIQLNGPTNVLTGWEKSTMIKEGERRAQSFMDQSGNQELGEQYDALIRIIEKCKKNNIQVILVTVPTLPCFYTNFTPQFMEKFYADMAEISSGYDVEYINYTGDERFLKDYRIFYDTDHFNKEGATLFTEMFLEDTRDLLKLHWH